MYFALSLSQNLAGNVSCESAFKKLQTNYGSSIIFDGFVDLQNESAT